MLLNPTQRTPSVSCAFRAFHRSPSREKSWPRDDGALVPSRLRRSPKGYDASALARCKLTAGIAGLSSPSKLASCSSERQEALSPLALHREGSELAIALKDGARKKRSAFSELLGNRAR